MDPEQKLQGGEEKDSGCPSKPIVVTGLKDNIQSVATKSRPF